MWAWTPRCEAAAVRVQRRRDDAHRCADGAALDLHRPGHRLQPADLVPGADHGLARRRHALVGAAGRRAAAGAAVRAAVGALPRPLLHPARPELSRHRLLPAARRDRSRENAEASMSLLEVQGLRKTFGGLVAVHDLSFTVERGQIVGLLGPNGSGKTTAMNLISGALQPEHGAVVFKGHDI